MKKIARIFLLLSAAAALLDACNKEPEQYTLDVPDDRMQVTPSSNNLVLDRTKADEEAVTFTWADATPRGDDARITYLFRLYDFNDKENHATSPVEIEGQQHSVSFTHRQINNILAAWGKPYGETNSVVGEVIAEVSGTGKYMKPELSLAIVQVVGYNPVNLMYLIIPQADGPQRAITMTSSPDNENIYFWKGILTPCKFKFSLFNDGSPAYYDAGDGKIRSSESDSGQDLFECNQEAAYEITVDLKAMTVGIAVIPIFHLHVFVGTNGQETHMELIDQEIGSDWFYWEGELPAGATVRFCRTETGEWPSIIPGEDDSQIEVNQGDALYTTPVSGHYVMSFVGKDEKKLILKDICYGTGLWMPVGDAFASVPDWSPSDSYSNGKLFLKPTDKKYEPHIWRLTTEFKLNASNGNREGFKILSQAGWGDPALHPIVGGIDPVNQWTDVELNGNDDKWNPSQDGVWTLEVDLHAMKLRMIK